MVRPDYDWGTMPVSKTLPLLLAAAFLFSCADDKTSSPAAPGDSALKAAKSLAKREAAARVFSEDTIRSFELILAPESLAVIDANPTAEQWVTGTLVMDGDTAKGVGIRYKGAEGAWYACVEGGPWGGGRKICPLNMKVKIDHTDRDATFHGLKSFQFHAMNDHASLLTEKVSYWFVHRMGIPAPRTAHCRLSINGRFEGFFLHVEEIDSRFVDTWQPGSDGNLFKEVWPLSWDSTANSDQTFVDALHTNGKHPEVARMHAFAAQLDSAKDLAAVRAAMERWLDVPEMLAFAATSFALDNDDGPFHWYALNSSGQGSRPHNFYWMEDPARDKLRLVPWDLDKSFQLVANPDMTNAIEIQDAWGTTSHDCRNFGPDWPQRSAACDKLIAGMASYDDLYQAKLRATLDGPFAKIDSLLDTWQTRLRPVIAALPDTNQQGISVDRWTNGVADLRQEIQDAKAAVAAEIARAGR